MQIQVNTDDGTQGGDDLVGLIEAEVQAVLGRFESHLTRIEIHLGDENGGKSGEDDKRCMMEARPTGQQPIAVTHRAATVEQAYTGAARKLRSMLESKFGRLQDQKGGVSIRDNDLE